MPVALPAIAAAAASYSVGLAIAGTTIAGTFAATALQAAASFLASTIVSSLLPKPKSPDLTSQLNNAGAGRTQQVRQPTAPHQIGFGRYKTSGPILAIHTANDDGGRANGYLYLLHGISGIHLKAIGTTYLGDDLSTDSKFAGLVRIGKHLGETTQAADSEWVAEIPSVWTADHRLRGRAYIATRLKWSEAAFASGIPNISAIVDGNDEIYDPR